MPDVFSTLEDSSNVVLDYTSRDFTAIRSQLVGLARGFMPEWETIGEASDFGTLLLELFAYMGDVMHFYIDRTASEAFLGTALRRQSVLYIADMLGYTPIGQQSAIVILQFSLDINAVEDVTLPAGTRVHNDASNADSLIVFETDADVILRHGDGITAPAPVSVAATEGVVVHDFLLGESSGSPNTEFVIPDKGVVHNSVKITSREGGQLVEWTEITDLSLARPTQPVFTTFMDDAELTHVVFGDNSVGRIPPVNAELFVTYRFGVGVEANDLPSDTLVVMVSTTDTADVMWAVSVTNPAAPVGGTDPESVDAMRNSIPRAAARLKNRAITLNDYADLALQVPGVAKSMSHGTVYTAVHVRIAPTDGNANDTYMAELCQQVERYMADKVIVGSTVYAEPTTVNALWQLVYIRVKVHVQDAYNRTTVGTTVQNALRQMMDFDNVDFGTRISIGQVYRTALAVQGVEWVDLIWLDDLAPATTVIEKGIWVEPPSSARTINDVIPTELLIPKIDPTSKIELETDFPLLPEEADRTHDGLWVQAVGGLVGT
jgi:hypothetical protein